MTFARRSGCVLAASLAVSVFVGCGKKPEEEARVAPAPAPAPQPVPGRPGGVPADPIEITRPPEPPVPKVTLAEVLARDAETWAATADAREAARTKQVEFEKKLAAAFRVRGAMGEKVPPEVMGVMSLSHKSETGGAFGSLEAFSPDGRRIAVREHPKDGDPKRWYRVVDLTSGEDACRFDAGPKSFGSGAFSPDGTVFTLRSSDNGTYSLWDAKTGELRHRADAGRLTWSLKPEVKGTGWVASLSGRLVRLDGATGAVVKEFGTPSMNAAHVVVSPSGSIVAANSNFATLRPGRISQTCISLWDWATGAPLAELEFQGPSSHRLLFSPDSRTLYSQESNTIVAWDLPTRTSRTLHQDKDMSAPVLSPDGVLLAYNASPDLVVRDLRSGRERRLRSSGRFSPDANPVFFPGGTLLATTSNSWFVVWDVARSRPAE